MRAILIILSALFLVGCSSVKVYKLEPYTKLSSQSIHINTPLSSHRTKWEAWYINSTKNNIQLFRHLPNMMSEDVGITVSTHSKEDIPLVSMLYKDKNDAMEEHYKN